MSDDASTIIDQSALNERASDAFAALGNETRLAVLLALWEDYDPLATSPGLSFSALRERVGVRDSGQFNYHLEQLRGEFVRKTEAGYTLTEAGRRIIQTVVGTVGLDEPAPDPVAADKPCPVCDGPTEFRYTNGQVFFCCTACPGLYGGGGGRPDGTLTSTECTRSAFAGRDLREVYDATATGVKGRFETMIQGVCPECLGVVARSMRVCGDHTAEGLCDACGRGIAANIELTCVVCKQFAYGPVRSLMKYHPAVRSLYIDHDVPFEYDPDPTTLLTRRLWPAGTIEQEIVAVDPPAVRVTLEYDGGTIAYTVDEDLELITNTTADRQESE